MNNSHFAALAWLLTACSATPAVNTNPGAPSTVTSTSTASIVQLESDPELESPIRHAADRVWAVLPDVFRDLGLGGAVMSDRPRVFGNDRVSANRIAGQNPQMFFRCANEASGMGSTMRYRLQFSIRTAVTAAQDGTSKLNTAISGQASPVDGSSAAKLNCVSNGKLERELRRAVIAKLGP
ncbi:MAG TPA: hypothetical protein VGD49_08145 [Longimicrobiales bacterium]